MKTRKARKMKSTQYSNDMMNCENKSVKPVENDKNKDTEL